MSFNHLSFNEVVSLYTESQKEILHLQEKLDLKEKIFEELKDNLKTQRELIDHLKNELKKHEENTTNYKQLFECLSQIGI